MVRGDALKLDSPRYYGNIIFIGQITHLHLVLEQAQVDFKSLVLFITKNFASPWSLMTGAKRVNPLGHFFCLSNFSSKLESLWENYLTEKLFLRKFPTIGYHMRHTYDQPWHQNPPLEENRYTDKRVETRRCVQYAFSLLARIFVALHRWKMKDRPTFIVDDLMVFSFCERLFLVWGLRW